MEKGKKKRTTDISKEVVRMMLRTLLSTTLRIFVPTTVLFIIGYVIDKNCGTLPWGMIIGATLGIIIAIVLVALQLKEIKADNKNQKGKAKNGSKHQS